MNKRIDSDEFDFLDKKESKFTSKKVFEESHVDSDLQDYVSVLTRETLKENKRVVNFMEELKVWKSKVSREGYISIKITDYESLKAWIEELENQLLLQTNNKASNDDSFELKDLREELKYKNDQLRSRDDEILELKK